MPRYPAGNKRVYTDGSDVEACAPCMSVIPAPHEFSDEREPTIPVETNKLGFAIHF